MEFRKPKSVMAVFFVGLSVMFIAFSIDEFRRGLISDGVFSVGLGLIDGLLAWKYWDGVED